MTPEEIAERVKQGKYVLFTFNHVGNGAMVPGVVMANDRPFIGDVISIEEERKRVKREDEP